MPSRPPSRSNPSEGAPVVRVPMRSARPLIGRLQLAGVAVPPLLAGLGIELADVVAPEASVDLETYVELWRRGLALSRDALLGFHTAELADIRIIGALTYESEFLPLQLFAQSETLGEALPRLCRYLPLGHPPSRWSMAHHGERVTVVHQLAGGREPPSAITHFILSLVVQGIRNLTAEQVVPEEVRLVGPPLPDSEEVVRRLGAPVHFNAVDDAFVLRKTDLAARFLTANPTLAQVLERKAEALLSSAGAFVLHVKAVMHSHLHAGDVSAEQTAANLDMALRTYNRRLQEHGTSHREVLDQVRLETAVAYLDQGGRTVAEVALLLGFSSPSAFQRAFRRWSGQSPGKFQRADGPDAPELPER